MTMGLAGSPGGILPFPKVGSMPPGPPGFGGRSRRAATFLAPGGRGPDTVEWSDPGARMCLANLLDATSAKEPTVVLPALMKSYPDLAPGELVRLPFANMLLLAIVLADQAEPQSKSALLLEAHPQHENSWLGLLPFDDTDAGLFAVSYGRDYVIGCSPRDPAFSGKDERFTTHGALIFAPAFRGVRTRDALAQGRAQPRLLSIESWTLEPPARDAGSDVAILSWDLRGPTDPAPHRKPFVLRLGQRARPAAPR